MVEKSRFLNTTHVEVVFKIAELAFWNRRVDTLSNLCSAMGVNAAS